MVVELVLSALVTQAVSHYSGRGFGWFDQQVADLAKRAADGDDDARRAVGVELADRLRELPRDDTGGTSAAGSRERMVAEILFDPPPREHEAQGLHAEAALSPRIAKFMTTLDGTFHAVHAFPRSVTAVPGWFHTELCVAVVDCRSRNGMWFPQVPLHWPLDHSGPWFAFDDVDGPSGSPRILAKARTGVPRVTVIECDDLDERREILEFVRAQVTDLHQENQHWSKPLLAEVAGVDPTRVRAVLQLHEDRVLLGEPACDVRGEDEDLDSWRERPKVGPTVVALDDPAGVRTMKADLVRQVLAEADHDAEWLDF